MITKIGTIFEIDSDTNPDVTYTVVLLPKDKQYTCSCPDWTYRHEDKLGYECKHIKHVSDYVRTLVNPSCEEL